MINFEKKVIEIPANSGLNGNQIYLMVEQELKKLAEAEESGKLPTSLDTPYEVQTIKLGERTGQEGENVGLSVVLLQRLQLKETWEIVSPETGEGEEIVPED